MKKFIHRLSNLLALLSALCVALLMVAICLDVGSRLFFNRSIQGVVEYGEFLMVALVYLGLGYSQMTNQHVAVDVVVTRLPRRLAFVSEICGRLLTIGVVLWLFVATSQLALHSLESRESRFGLVEVPVWPDRIIIALGILVLLLELSISFHKHLRSGNRNASPEANNSL